MNKTNTTYLQVFQERNNKILTEFVTCLVKMLKNVKNTNNARNTILLF